MNVKRFFVAIVFLTMVSVSNVSGQVEDSPNIAGTPPKILLLVHQEFKFGKAGERQKLEVAISRACGHLDVPNDWIDLDSISGPPEALFFDPFDSFEQLDTASAVWGRIGMPAPTFIVFLPMRALKPNDDLLNWRRSLREAEGEEASHRMEQIARDAYAATESNLYVISPETSHVSKDFADGDHQFWSPKPPAASMPSARKDAGSAKNQ